MANVRREGSSHGLARVRELATGRSDAEASPVALPRRWLAAFALLVAPAAIIAPGAMVDNTIMFPLGLTRARSGAASPLPGVLLASTGHAGKLAAAGLLVTALAGVAVWLARRPPATVAAATWRIIVTLVLLFLLAPSTRVGYFTYPLTLWAWLRVSSLEARIRLTT